MLRIENTVRTMFAADSFEVESLWTSIPYSNDSWGALDVNQSKLGESARKFSTIV